MESEIMHTVNLISETSSRPKFNRIAALAVSALLIVGCSQLSFAQKSGPATFSSPGEASNALFQAVQNGDEEALQRILGCGKEVTSSGDEIEDKLERERFSQKYQEMHRLVPEPDGSTVLYIGAENWPFPIPLVSQTKTKTAAWYFDSDSGTLEILFRTVGENETTAIEVCRALAKAKERSEINVASDDPIGQYAQSLATARTPNADNTSRNAEKESSPFHGYYFRVMTGNSTAMANSNAGVKKTAGLALVAYPAEYGSSGIVTFIVTLDGVVYEKDLGPKATKVAPALKKRSPDSSWHVADGAPTA
jgi:DUF2950 family protein